MQHYLEKRMVEMEYELTYKQYAETLKEGKLLGLRCNDCGAYTAAGMKTCSDCISENLQAVELSGRGKVNTFTVIRVPPEGFDAPYIVALVELAEGPWVMGNITDVDPNEATMDLIGQQVTVGHKTHSGDRMSGGEIAVLTFSIIS